MKHGKSFFKKSAKKTKFMSEIIQNYTFNTYIYKNALVMPIYVHTTIIADFAVVDGVVNASQVVGKNDDDDCRLWIIAVAMTRMTI
jgi:hypothetical protein